MAFILFRAGTSRWVILIPALGLVFKIAKVGLFSAVKEFFCWLKLGGWTAAKRWCRYPVGVWGGARNLLFLGIQQNWNEWRLSRSRHPLLARTYLSVGLLNVQEYVPPFPDQDQFYQQVILTAVDSAYMATCPDLHSVYYTNFGLEQGRVRMLDYGSVHASDFVQRFGDAICSLDLTPP